MLGRIAISTLSLLMAATSLAIAQEERRPATVADLDAALQDLPADAVKAVYAKKKVVKTGKDPVRVSDYVAVDKDGEPALRKNLHRTDGEFADQKFLDCTTFAAPVLHRIVHGSFRGFAQTKVNDYGDRVAAFYNLERCMQLPVKEFLGKAADSEWRKENAGVYFFDLRRGVLGHVGFLVVEEGRTRHVHMSMDKEDAGWRDDAGFAAYVKGSTYNKKGGTISLFRVTVVNDAKK